MRLFIAAEFGPDLKDAVIDAITRARIANPPWRWVARDNIHVTLRFLGDTPDEDVDILAETVSRACSRVPAFEIQLGKLGGFPNLKKPRVLFYEVTEGAAELTSLAGRIEAALFEELAIPKEDRPFRAHATVARVKNPIPPDVAARLEKAPPVDGRSQRFEKVSLMASELHRDGAIYRLVKGIALAGAK
jgi:2'-5' RNA ligase